MWSGLGAEVSETNAPVLNATLKRALEPSNTEALARVVMAALSAQGVATTLERALDYNVLPGVSNDKGDGDE